MAELPSGTVTLLFSDIEGSTRLLDALGRDRYGATLAEHRRVLREAFEECGGTEVDTQGDAFFVAFSTAQAAAAAAADAQRSLAVHEWPEQRELRVRMGLHTGSPALVEGRYVGIDVHRAARIAAAAHGGQVLLSQTTRDLILDELPDGLAVHDLGEHRLKDLTRPQRLYQLLIREVVNEFPPPKTLENRPVNLPMQPTPLIGREDELRELGKLLRQKHVRLLTLTGTGGVGKTRLALQVAADLIDDYPSGVFFVPLASITEPNLLAPTIAQTVGVRERGAEPLIETLCEYLRDKQMLLLLDNFEQIVTAAPSVTTLLTVAAGLDALVTSRTPLLLSGERTYSVPPLSLPDPESLLDVSTMNTYDAVALFVDRAQAVKPNFTVTNANARAVAEICVRLDGLPLALELAARRVRVLPPQTLLGRLDQRLKLLTGGARDLDARQRTLRATIEWSHELLSSEEKTLFGRLGIFSGGCRLDAAEAICDPDGELGIDVVDGLTLLVEKNLLWEKEDSDGEPRFSMLETIGEYAREQLRASGEWLDLSRRHLAHYVDVAEAHGATDMAKVELQVARLEADLGNLRAALAWSAAAGVVPEELRLAAVLSGFWIIQGHLTEGRRWLEDALSKAGREATDLRAYLLTQTAYLAIRQGHYARARVLAEETLAVARSIGSSHYSILALLNLGNLAAADGDTARAASIYKETTDLARASGTKHDLALSLGNEAGIAWELGHFQRAKQLATEALGLGHVAQPLITLGRVALGEDRYDEAASLFAQSLDRCRKLSDRPNAVAALEGFAAIAAHRGDGRRAARLASAASAIWAQTGGPRSRMSGDRHDRFVRELERGLAPDDLATARTVGMGMTFDEVVAYALQESVT